MTTIDRNSTLEFVRRKVSPIAIMFCFGVGLLCSGVRADTHWQDLHQQVQAGKLKPLTQILAELAETYVGEVIDVELDEDDGLRIYEIEMVGPQGQVVEFEVNAVTGQLIGMEGSNIQGMLKR